MAIGQVIQGVISTFINAYPNKKLMNYSYLEQIKDLFPSFGISIIMGMLVWSMNFLSFNIYVLLPMQIVVGFTVYFVLSKLLKLNSYLYLINTIKGVKK